MYLSVCLVCMVKSVIYLGFCCALCYLVVMVRQLFFCSCIYFNDILQLRSDSAGPISIDKRK